MAVVPMDFQGVVAGEGQVHRTNLLGDAVQIQFADPRVLIDALGTGALAPQEFVGVMTNGLAPTKFQKPLVLVSPYRGRNIGHDCRCLILWLLERKEPMTAV